MVATADFRRNESTNFVELVPKQLRESMGPSDVVVFRSGSGTQIAFVFAPGRVTRTTRYGDEQVEVLPSYRLRLPPNRPWNPLMLNEYARSAGLKIEGIRTLREHLENGG